MKFKILFLSVSVLFLLLPVSAFSASFFLTNKQFSNRGDGVFVGEITNVQVSSSDQFSESGSVQVRVVNVISGTISVTSLTFSYQRALAPTDDPSNWDLIQPTYVSLAQFGVGRSILVHFTAGSNGSILVASGSNSVQDARDGLILGKIKSIDSKDSQANRLHRQIEVEIVEVVFGWVDGSEVNLRWHAWPNEFVLLTGDEVFIKFDKSGIREVTKATPKLLAQLQEADTN